MLNTSAPRFGFDVPRAEGPTLRLGYTPAHQAGLVVLQRKPFFMLGGAKGYPEAEPWVDVEDAVTRIWVGGPSVVKRVLATLELMQATVPGSWVYGTTQGALQLPRPRVLSCPRRAPQRPPGAPQTLCPYLHRPRASWGLLGPVNAS